MGLFKITFSEQKHKNNYNIVFVIFKTGNSFILSIDIFLNAKTYYMVPENLMVSKTREFFLN